MCHKNILCCVKAFQFAKLKWNNKGIVQGPSKKELLKVILMY
jgi:hypothetical protein